MSLHCRPKKSLKLFGAFLIPLLKKPVSEAIAESDVNRTKPSAIACNVIESGPAQRVLTDSFPSVPYLTLYAVRIRSAHARIIVIDGSPDPILSV
jgi:hypothetical protein